MFILFLASRVNRLYECQTIEMDEGTVLMRSKILPLHLVYRNTSPRTFSPAIHEHPAALDAPIIGADVVELNPDRHIHGMTAVLAAKLAKELAAVTTANPFQ